MSQEKHLKMSFDPQTIEHLGVKMYSRIPNAIAELIANSYDADATSVEIRLYDNDDGKWIEVIDDGVGMEFNEINDNFLRIGRNRRATEGNKSPSGKRKVTGKKGLGKLALFGIGDIIEVITTKEGSGNKITFTMNWHDLISTEAGDYAPEFKIEDCDENLKGTTIVLKDIRRNSPFDQNGLAISLSKLFNFFDSDFTCSIFLNDGNPIEVNNDLKFENLEGELEWRFPGFFENVSLQYGESSKITGKIISTPKPLKPGLRGVTLFAKGRMVNAPEFFGAAESSHGFSYLTGWLEVDFVDDIPDEMIATNRQSLNWDLPEISGLREYLRATMTTLERVRREELSIKRRKEISKKTKINVPGWFKTLPEEILSQVEPVVNAILDESELEGETQSNFVRNLHQLVPEYPYYHWRHLHPEVKDASKEGYDNGDYYKAFTETVKRYINSVRNKSGSTQSSDSSMMGAVFGQEPAKPLKVSIGYTKPGGKGDFSSDTKANVEEGQKYLSMGVVKGARNPVVHEELSDLKESGLFSEKDCLDALSLLSHLFRRLDDAE